MITTAQKVGSMTNAASVPLTYAASAVSVFFGLTAGEWQAVGVLGGLILGTLTFAVSFYFKHKHLQLLKREI